MAQREIEDLVERITARVQERLGRSLPAEPSPSHCEATASTCSACGHCARRKGAVLGKIIELGAVRISAASGLGPVEKGIASMIDHTLLKPDATKEEIKKICQEAKQYGFKGVCVNSSFIPQVARLLRGSEVIPVAVVGFPLGAASTGTKAFEAREAVSLGAREVDMVINIGALKSKDYGYVLDDIKRVVEAARPCPVKVILEMGALATEEKVAGCVLSKAAGARFVKTSTGFGPGGATVADVALMRKVVGEEMEIKASGGIRTLEDALKMREAGADRIGASASVAIVTGKGKEKKAGSY